MNIKRLSIRKILLSIIVIFEKMKTFVYQFFTEINKRLLLLQVLL